MQKMSYSKDTQELVYVKDNRMNSIKLEVSAPDFALNVNGCFTKAASALLSK
jgi:hypothetical protein